MEKHTLTVDGDVGEGDFGTPSHQVNTSLAAADVAMLLEAVANSVGCRS
jgi:hypothetical protein